jgi:hypothetical protein
MEARSLPSHRKSVVDSCATKELTRNTNEKIEGIPKVDLCLSARIVSIGIVSLF